MQFTVNTEVCTRCGLCVKDCPTSLLVMTSDGPKAGAGGCIACGHCVSLCPVEALDSDITPRSEQVRKDTSLAISKEQAAYFMRQRRSIRQYLKKPVPTEAITEVLDMARLAPTATNTQGISYIVIRNKETLRKISDMVVDWMRLAAKKAAIMRLYLRTVQAEVEKGNDYILRDAPVLVVAIGPKKDVYRTHDSGHSTLTYAELYAPMLGLGTCWAGFFEHACEAEYKPLLEILGVPEDKVVAGALLMGYPAVKYKNLVERNPLEVTFDKV